jgi:hypothetical protein
MFDAEFLGNLIMHIGFIATLLGLIFFTYGSYIEQQVTVTQVEDLTNQYFTFLNLVITPAQKQLLNSAFSQIQQPDMSQQDSDVNNANINLRNKAIIILSILFVSCLIVAYILSIIFKFSYWELLKENLIIMLFILITEICFATFIAKNYLAADPNYVKLTIINSLLKYANS